MANKFDARQTISRDVLDQIADGVADKELDDLLRSIDSELTMPLRMSASSTPDLVVSIGAISITNPEHSRNSIIPPISGSHPAFTSGTVTFPAASGGNITFSSGSPIQLNVSVGQFLKVGIYLDSSGNLTASFGAEGASIAAASSPANLANTFALGYIVVENVGGVIQNIENSRIYQYVGGGSGGSSTGSGIKNYIANPDAQINTDSSTDTANVTMDRTTTAANLPEEGYKQYAWSVSASGAATDGTDYAQWDAAFAWDDADINTAELKAKVKATGGWKFVAWNTTDDVAASAESEEIIQDKTVRLTIDPQPTKTFVVRAIPTTANPPNIYATDVTLSPKTAGISTFGGWPQYDESTVTFSSTPTGWSLTRATFVPYKDPLNNIWRMTFNIRAAITAGSTPTVTIDGVTFKNGYSQALAVRTSLATVNANAHAVSNTGQISIVKDAASTEFNVSGDVELESKPTWADFDNTVLTATEAQLQNSSIRVHSSTLVLSGTPTLVPFSTPSHNDGGGFSYSGGQVTCLFNGKVSVTSVLEAASGSGGATITAQIYKSGTSIAQNQVKDSAFTSVSDSAIKVAYGDVLEIRASSSATPTLAATSDGTYFSVTRIPDRSAQIPGFPFTDIANDTDQVLVPRYRESGEGDIGTITNWASPGSKKYRWTRIGNIVHFWWYVTATSGSASSSVTTLQYDLPGDVPSPANHISNDASGEFPIPCSGAANTNNFVKNYIDNNAGTYRPSGAFDTNTAATYWSGYATWMINP